MSETSQKVYSAFALDHAVRLAEVASTKKVACPFVDQSELLLEVLRKAEFSYNKNFYDAEFDKSFFEDGKALKELAGDFHRFKYRWDRTGVSARTDIGYFGDGRENDFAQAFDNNEVIGRGLELLETGLRSAIDYRCSIDGGRPEKRPGLRAFVEEIRRGWMAQAPDIPFGDTFEGGINGDDRVPVSAAAKLVVEAMKILDPDVSGRDCETAMRAIKG